MFGRAVAGVLWGGCTQLFSMYPCYLSIRFSLYGFHVEVGGGVYLSQRSGLLGSFMWRFVVAGYQSRDDSYTRPGVPDELKWQPVMRGFPDDVEVLTEVGWVLFSNLYRAGVNGLVGSSTPLFDRDRKSVV